MKFSPHVVSSAVSCPHAIYLLVAFIPRACTWSFDSFDSEKLVVQARRFNPSAPSLVRGGHAALEGDAMAGRVSSPVAIFG